MLSDAAIFALEDQIGAAMGQVNAATAALVAHVAEVMREDSWQVPGIRSAEHYISWQAGCARSRARRLVTARRALQQCSEVGYRAGRRPLVGGAGRVAGDRIHGADPSGGEAS